jgi:hypothetical protein
MADLTGMMQAAAGSAGGGLLIQDVFSVDIWTGNGGTQTITNDIDLAGEGGLVWVKNRNDTVTHSLVRNDLTYLNSSSTAVSSGPSNLMDSFNSNGFTLGDAALGNFNTYTYVSWSFRKAPKFFDIVTYTGTGSSQTISHSLDATVGMLIIKKTSATGNWVTFARVGGAAGATNYAYFSCTGGLNSTAAADVASAGAEAAGNITTTVFKPNDLSCSGDGGLFDINASGATYVAYLFAHDNGGFGADENGISCGSYTGNGSATGPIVTLGYEPQWLMVKRIDQTDNWVILDSTRDVTNPRDRYLEPNTSDAEATGLDVDFNSTSFQLKTSISEVNANAGVYIYVAIRADM